MCTSSIHRYWEALNLSDYRESYFYEVTLVTEVTPVTDAVLQCYQSKY